MESGKAYLEATGQLRTLDPFSQSEPDATLSSDAREALFCANRIGNLIEDLEETLFTSGSRLRAVGDKAGAPAPPEPLVTMVRGTRQRLNTLEATLRKILERL